MKAANLKGRKFGRLTVIGMGEKIGQNATSLCRCECGVEKVIRNASLLKEKPTSSCGCWTKEKASERVKKNPPRLKHGCSNTITYNSWQGMVSRCTDPRNISYRRYGGRGITVCAEWADPETGFQQFLKDMEERPSPAHSIDRIKGGNYEPGNCRWATRPQQNQNVGLKKSNTSGYKGAIFFRGCKVHPWRSEIRCNGKKFNLGLYATKEEAALAYNIASEELQGEYGSRNALPPMNRDTVNQVFRKVRSVLNKNRR